MAKTWNSKWQEQLTVVLTDEARDRAGREVAALERKYRTIEEAKKRTAAEYSEEMKEIRAEMAKLADEANTGIGTRMVDVQEKPVFSVGVVRIVRLDTGEQVRVRDMHSDEQQGQLLDLGMSEAEG